MPSAIVTRSSAPPCFPTQSPAGRVRLPASSPGWSGSNVGTPRPICSSFLQTRLRAARALQNAALTCAGSGGRLHPVASLWRVSHAAMVRHALASDERRLGRVMQAVGLGVAEFGVDPVDPFFNVNTPEDLAWAEALPQARTARPEALPLDSAKGQPLESFP